MGISPRGHEGRAELALHLNTVLSSFLGFAFVIVSARLFDRTQVGRDFSLISAMMFLAAIAELNLGNVLLRFLPQLQDRRRSAVWRTFFVTSVVAFVLSVGFLVLAPVVSAQYVFVSEGGVVLGAAFVVAVVAWNLFAINDAALTALRRAPWVPTKNGVFGALKLVLMAVFGIVGVKHGIFHAWFFALVVVVIPMVVLLFRRGLASSFSEEEATRVTAAALLNDRRRLFRYMGADYVAALFTQAGTTVLPLVVVAVLGAHANGAFALGFTVITALEQLSMNATTVVVVEGAFNERRLHALVQRCLSRFVVMLAGIVVVGLACAPLSTWVFGAQYESDLPNLLRILLLGLIPQVIVFLFEAIARVRGRTAFVMMTTGVQMAVTLPLSFVLAQTWGINGVAWAWVIGHVVVAVFVLPAVLRVARTAAN